MGGHVIRSYGDCRPKLSNGPIQVSCFEQFPSGAGVERSRLNAVGLFKEFLRTLSPLGHISNARDIAEAVFYLTQASQVTGEVLHVDGGAHLGRW